MYSLQWPVSALDSGYLAKMLLFTLLSNLDCCSHSAQVVQDYELAAKIFDRRTALSKYFSARMLVCGSQTSIHVAVLSNPAPTGQDQHNRSRGHKGTAQPPTITNNHVPILSSERCSKYPFYIPPSTILSPLCNKPPSNAFQRLQLNTRIHKCHRKKPRNSQRDLWHSYQWKYTPSSVSECLAPRQDKIRSSRNKAHVLSFQ